MSVCLARVGVLVLVSCFCAGSVQARAVSQWFSQTSPWNVPISSSVRETEYSRSAVQAFIGLSPDFNINMDLWTPRLIYADSRIDPVQDILFPDNFGNKWLMPRVPVPASLREYIAYRIEHHDTDGMLCLYDAGVKGFYSFWKPTVLSDGKMGVRTGGFSPEAGAGWSRIGVSAKPMPYATPSLGRASGASYCGGLVRLEEVKAGVVSHALAIAWPVSLTLSSKVIGTGRQYPATYSDGVSLDRSSSVPMGARLQLDPSLTDQQLLGMGLNKRDLVLARALQVYGGYVVDTTGERGPAALCLENVMGAGKTEYKVSGRWPRALYEYFRFVSPPVEETLDSAASVGTPALFGKAK